MCASDEGRRGTSTGEGAGWANPTPLKCEVFVPLLPEQALFVAPTAILGVEDASAAARFFLRGPLAWRTACCVAACLPDCVHVAIAIHSVGVAQLVACTLFL